MAVKRGRKKRDAWWGHADPMPAIMKALGSEDARGDFLARVDDDPEDLRDWLSSAEAQHVPDAARSLIEKHFSVDEGLYFDEVSVSSGHCDVGLGFSQTLYARRRGDWIHYRIQDDNGQSRQLEPTREPMSDEAASDHTGPDPDYDWLTEAEELLGTLGANPSKTEIKSAARDYASEFSGSSKVARALIAQMNDLLESRKAESD